MRWRVEVPGALYRQARDRAGSDAQLADWVRAALAAYVAGQSPRQQLAAEAGRASAAKLSPDARRAKAQRAAHARWGTPHDDSP